MLRLAVAHTGQLPTADLAAARALLHDVFVSELTEDDWEHCLGGLHALLWEGAELVAHAALVQRRLLRDGRALRAGYVEGVGVRADRRRRGHGAAVMAPLEELAGRAYDLAALGATDEALPFYGARGWQVWTGPLAALTPAGVVPTPEEAGGVLVRPGRVPLELSGALTCDWRDGDGW